MKKLLKENNLNKIYIIPLIFILSLIYNAFVSPNAYTSQMIISIKEEQENKNIDFNNPFFAMQGQNAHEVYQMREYLTSKKAFQDLKLQLKTSGIDLERLKPSSFDPFNSSSYASPRNIEHITSIIINDQSKTVEFQTLGYDDKIGFEVNLAIIATLYSYFNEQNRLNSTISSINSLCDILSVLNKKQSNDPVKIGEELFDAKTGTELLLNIADSQVENCRASGKSNNYDGEEFFPLRLLSEFDADITKELLAKLYEENISQSFVADNLKIISEPNIPTDPDRKKTFLNSIIFTIILLFIFFGINIVSRLNKEYI